MILKPVKITLLSLLSCLSVFYADAQISLPNAGNSVSIDFTGFTGAGFNNPPAAGQLSSVDWEISGFSDVYTYGSINTSGDFARGTTGGNVTSGGIYANTSGGNTRLWIQPTGGDFTPGSLVLYLVNNTGSAIDFLDISYDVSFLNNESRANSFAFAYSSNNTVYSPVPALNVISTEALDGQDSVTTRTISLNGLAIPNGGNFYLKWTGDDVSGGGARDEFGLDNIDISVPLTNPDPIISFSTTSSTIIEGNSTITLLALIDFAPSDTIVVDVAVDAASTATQGLDFNLLNSQIIFPADSNMQQSVGVSILEDVLSEGVESVVIKLLNASNNAILVDSVHTISIFDNDQLSVQFNGFDVSVPENTNQVSVEVNIDNPNTMATSVDVKLLPNSTATNAVDFNFSDTTLIFPPSTDTVLSFLIDLIDDVEFEADETIQLALRNFSNGAVSFDSLFKITILEDDPIPSGPCQNLFFSEYIEGSGNNKALEIYNPGTQAVDLSKYTILRFNNTSTTASGTLGLNGTLAAGETYVIANSNADTLILNQADITSTITFYNGDDALLLLHINDTIDQIGRIGEGVVWPVGMGSTQNFTLVRKANVLQGTTNWNLGDDQWDVYASDFSDSLGSHTTISCSGNPIVQFSTSSVIIDESDGSYMVSVEILNPDTMDVSVDLVLDSANSSGLNGVDFTFSDTSITFLANSPAPVNIILDIIDNVIVEPDYQISLVLMDPSANASLGDSTITIIVEDDDELTLSFNPVDTMIFEDSGSLQIFLNMSGLNSDSTFVDLNILSQSEADSMDFSLSKSTIIFPPFDATPKLFTVAIIDDTTFEGDEFLILGASASKAGLVSPLSILIIENDTMVNNLTEPDLNGISVSPNPVADGHNVSISSIVSLKRVIVQDLSGQIINRRDLTGINNLSISLDKLPSGIYFLRIETREGKSVIKRLIKL
ncbi:MAG: T9SS type A sorting domain-containing protein [Chitinophagales bacterium]|nr:T9SS type A sorting domain-containing protein [Chitinophagales bacterium]